MAEIEDLTVSLPADMAAAVKGAVETGDYASTNEVVRAALHDWAIKRQSHGEPAMALKNDIDVGLADIAAGRVKPFDTARIIERGRLLSPSR